MCLKQTDGRQYVMTTIKNIQLQELNVVNVFSHGCPSVRELLDICASVSVWMFKCLSVYYVFRYLSYYNAIVSLYFKWKLATYKGTGKNCFNYLLGCWSALITRAPALTSLHNPNTMLIVQMYADTQWFLHGIQM